MVLINVGLRDGGPEGWRRGVIGEISVVEQGHRHALFGALALLLLAADPLPGDTLDRLVHVEGHVPEQIRVALDLPEPVHVQLPDEGHHAPVLVVHRQHHPLELHHIQYLEDVGPLPPHDVLDVLPLQHPLQLY